SALPLPRGAREPPGSAPAAPARTRRSCRAGTPSPRLRPPSRTVARPGEGIVVGPGLDFPLPAPALERGGQGLGRHRLRRPGDGDDLVAAGGPPPVRPPSAVRAASAPA